MSYFRVSLALLLVLVTPCLNLKAETIPYNPEDYVPPSSTSTTSTSSSTTTTMRCEYNSISATYVHSWSLGYDNFQAGETGVPSCVTSRLYSAYSECAYLYNIRRFTYWEDMDNCIAYKAFGAHQWLIWISHSYLAQYFLGQPSFFGSTTYDWANYAYKTEGSFGECTWYGLCYAQGYHQSARIYLKQNQDSTCTAVSSIPNGASACYAGTYYWYSSPISLLLDDNFDIDDDLRFTEFPIDPTKGKQWSVWKASEKAPLLVYDPDKKRQITSATQLFGNWTFGGQSEAKLNDCTEDCNVDDNAQGSLAKPWPNGYAALATLDRNGDRQISDEELEPLALWFDKNRNGISEFEEVKKLAEFGIVALYFSPNRVSESTNNIYADVGYKRVVNDRVIIGSSVDWHSDTAKSKGELVKKHLAPAFACSSNSQSTTDNFGIFGVKSFMSLAGRHKSDFIHQRSKLDTFLMSKPAGKLSGLWRWQSDQKSSSETEGYIGFSELTNGALQGHLYSTFGPKSSNVGFSSIFSMVKFNGRTSRLKNGSWRIEFTVRPDELSLIKTKAIYYPDKEKIVGKSTAYVSHGTKPLNITYSWVATPVY